MTLNQVGRDAPSRTDDSRAPIPTGSAGGLVTTVAEVIERKGGGVYSVAPNATVYEALELMASKDVGALLVLDGHSLRGIFSERDYARRLILVGRASKDTPVRSVMSHKVLCVQPERTMDECMALMTDKHIRHLPVESDGRIVGVISIGDVVKAVINTQRFVIDQLEHYIAGV